MYSLLICFLSLLANVLNVFGSTPNSPNSELKVSDKGAVKLDSKTVIDSHISSGPWNKVCLDLYDYLQEQHSDALDLFQKFISTNNYAISNSNSSPLINNLSMTLKRVFVNIKTDVCNLMSSEAAKESHSYSRHFFKELIATQLMQGMLALSRPGSPLKSSDSNSLPKIDANEIIFGGEMKPLKNFLGLLVCDQEEYAHIKAFLLERLCIRYTLNDRAQAMCLHEPWQAFLEYIEEPVNKRVLPHFQKISQKLKLKAGQKSHKPNKSDLPDEKDEISENWEEDFLDEQTLGQETKFKASKDDSLYLKKEMFSEAKNVLCLMLAHVYGMALMNDTFIHQSHEKSSILRHQVLALWLWIKNSDFTTAKSKKGASTAQSDDSVSFNDQVSFYKCLLFKETAYQLVKIPTQNVSVQKLCSELRAYVLKNSNETTNISKNNLFNSVKATSVFTDDYETYLKRMRMVIKFGVLCEVGILHKPEGFRFKSAFRIGDKKKKQDQVGR